MRSLLLIAFAGAALAQQFLDDEVAPVAKTAVGFTTTADITNATSLAKNASSSGSSVPELTIAKSGYTIGGTADAPTVTATMDFRYVVPGQDVTSSDNIWIVWSTAESGMMHVHQM